MNAAQTFFAAQDFLMALACSQPRILGMFAVVPLFNPQLIPRMMRLAVAAGTGLIVAPTLLSVAKTSFSPVTVLFIAGKEAFIGFALGYAVALPLWAFEAVGFLIDNQRGASISATLNPLTGNDSSPLGILFNQAFIVFFLISGGFPLMLGVLYDSYRLWPVLEWAPTLRNDSITVLLGQLDQFMRLAMLYGAPVIVAMFLSELGLALVSRFVPQLQVFFLAMPIKSALALLVLILYATNLFALGRDSVSDLRFVVPALQKEWAPK
jgi:type III secretion protein T